MKLGEARIGYAGYGADLRGPGDRRRFCAYAAHRCLAFEQADLDREYDLVLITHNGDIPGWTARKRRDGDRLRFVFELVDAYFNQTNPVRRHLKGSARYLLGTDSRLSPDFLRTLIRACEEADAVICSTEEQRDAISLYNPNVTISFDWMDDELSEPKRDYSRSGKLKVVWEGLSTSLPTLQLIGEPLNQFRDDVELHVVTDPLIYRHFGRYRPYPSMNALSGIQCETLFHDWDESSFSRRITDCDLAVIPIDPGNRLWWGKPENKLVLLWKLGMPVLTTATPAYRRAMAGAGLAMACAAPDEWVVQLRGMIEAGPSQLESVGRQGKAFAEGIYTKTEFLRRFDAVFESLGIEIE